LYAFIVFYNVNPNVKINGPYRCTSGQPEQTNASYVHTHCICVSLTSHKILCIIFFLLTPFPCAPGTVMSSFSEGELMLMTVHVSMPVSKYVCEHQCYNHASFFLLMWGAVFTACEFFPFTLKVRPITIKVRPVCGNLSLPNIMHLCL